MNCTSTRLGIAHHFEDHAFRCCCGEIEAVDDSEFVIVDALPATEGADPQ